MSAFVNPAVKQLRPVDKPCIAERPEFALKI